MVSEENRLREDKVQKSDEDPNLALTIDSSLTFFHPVIYKSYGIYLKSNHFSSLLIADPSHILFFQI